jgi:hypothetical protein
LSVALQAHTPVQFELVPNECVDAFYDHLLGLYIVHAKEVKWSEYDREVYLPGIPKLDDLIKASGWFYLVGLLLKEACDPGDLDALVRIEPSQLLMSTRFSGLLQEHCGPLFHSYRNVFVFDVMRALNVMGLSYKAYHRPQDRMWDYSANFNRNAFTIHNDPIVEVW